MAITRLGSSSNLCNREWYKVYDLDKALNLIGKEGRIYCMRCTTSGSRFLKEESTKEIPLNGEKKRGVKS